MLRNEAAHDGTAPAMGQKSAEGGLINGVLDDLKSPTAIAIGVGAAIATVAAIKFGGPLLGKGAQAAEEATGIASGALKQGETCVLGVVRDGKIEPATDALLMHSKPIGSGIEPATDALVVNGQRIPLDPYNAYWGPEQAAPFNTHTFFDPLRKMEYPPPGFKALNADAQFDTAVYRNEAPRDWSMARYPGPNESFADRKMFFEVPTPNREIVNEIPLSPDKREKLMAGLSRSLQSLIDETRRGLTAHELAPALKPDQIDKAASAVLRGEEPATALARQAGKTGA